MDAITCQVTGAGGYAVNLSPHNVVIDVNDSGDIISCFFTNEQRTLSVPTMTEWGMIIIMLLAGLGAVYHLRRQKRENN